MTIPPAYDDSELPERLRQLVAMEIERVVDDLDARRVFLVEIWSRHRDRGPFLDTVFTRWRTISLPDLALLPSEAIPACEAFYRELDELKMYFQFTQDMPTTLDEMYGKALVRVAAYGELAVRLLGGAPPIPIVDFVELEEPRPRLSLLSSPSPPPEAPEIAPEPETPKT
jgi:hypothetical protein